jgi:hypothetical protein
MNRTLYIISLQLTLASCAISKITITSNPIGGVVSVSDASGIDRPLGVTPITVSADEVLGSSQYAARLLVRAKGKYTESVLIPRSLLPNNQTLHFSMRDIEKIEIERLANADSQGSLCGPNAKNDISKLARGIASSQALISQKEYRSAEMQLNALIASFPVVSVLHALLGNVRYISKNYRGALKAYKRAQNLDPTNTETQTIINKLSAITDPQR